MNIQPASANWISADFSPPLEGHVGGFVLVPLGPLHLEGDFEAVMASRNRLRDFFGIGDAWPAPNMSKQDNLRDLEWHAGEFKKRSSFTYTVTQPSQPGTAGCVYVYPPTREGFDVELFVWLRSDRYSADQEQVFICGLKAWLAAAWNFKNIGMPGCELTWLEWGKLRSNNRAMPSPYGPN